MLDKTKERPKNLDDKFQVFSFDPPEPEKVFSVNGFWGECDKENFYVRNIFSIRKRGLLLLLFDWLLIHRQSLGRAEANPHVYAEIKGL